MMSLIRGIVFLFCSLGSIAFATSHAEVRLHSEPKTSWQARIDSIQNAKSRIFVEVFYLENDSVGLGIIDALIQAKQQNPQLDIRLLIDAWGSSNFPQKSLCLLEKNQISTKLFSPPTVLGKATDERTHRKIWVSDETAIIGGRNLSDENFSQPHSHLDWDVEIRGPITEKISASFLEGWNSTKSKKIRCEGVAIQSTVSMIATLDESIQMPSWFSANADWIADIPGKRNSSRPVRQKVINLIDSAKSSLFIDNYIFLPVTDLAKTISRAHDRGVQMSLYTNGPMSGYWMGELTSCSSLVEIDYWMKKSVSVAVTGKDRKTHGKAFLIDDQTLSIGSFNFDGRSALWNAETLLTLSGSPQLIAEFKQESSSRIFQGHKVKSLEEIFKAYQFSSDQENKCRFQSRWRSILGLFL